VCSIAKHTSLLEELADATLDGNRKQHMELLTTVPLLIIDDLGMRAAATDGRRGAAGNHYATIRTRQFADYINRPVEDWGKLLAIVPPSPPCSIGCCTTGTCSNAAHAVGESKPAVRERANDKCKGNRMRGKERRRRRDS